MTMKARQEPPDGGLENNPFANKHYQQKIGSLLQMEVKWHTTDRRLNFAHKPGTELILKAQVGKRLFLQTQRPPARY